MAKKKATPATQEDFESELKSEAVVFNTLTIGISPNDVGGFNIIKIPVDSKGFETGDVEVLDTAESKFEAIEKFKINVVKQGIL